MNDNFFVVEILTPVQPAESEMQVVKTSPRGALRVFFLSRVARIAVAVTVTGVVQLATIARPTVRAEAPAYVNCVDQARRPGLVIDQHVGQGIASLLRYRLQSDEPTDDDLISPKDLL